MPSIGTLNEKPLHAALKQWYARPGDRLEVAVDGFVIDLVRGDLLVEIQTGGFASIRSKLSALVPSHRVRLIYPIALEKWIVKLPQDGGGSETRRKSPKRGRIEDLFGELVSFPRLLAERNFSLEILLTREEEVRRYVGKKAWRRHGWGIEERRLLEVVESRLFARQADVRALLPERLPEPFTAAELADAAELKKRLAQQMAYCLREAGAIERVGKRGRANLYRSP